MLKVKLQKIKEIIVEGIYKDVEDEKLRVIDKENNIKLDYTIVHMYL
ncbi:hypothetical protein [Intestinibacter sp.]